MQKGAYSNSDDYLTHSQSSAAKVASTWFILPPMQKSNIVNWTFHDTVFSLYSLTFFTFIGG